MSLGLRSTSCKQEPERPLCLLPWAAQMLEAGCEQVHQQAGKHQGAGWAGRDSVGSKKVVPVMITWCQVDPEDCLSYILF